jgi:hypothetical protein
MNLTQIHNISEGCAKKFIRNIASHMGKEKMTKVPEAFSLIP